MIMRSAGTSIAPSGLSVVLGAAPFADLSLTPARATVLQVSPVLVRFEPTQQGETIQLVNNGNEPVQAQVRVMRWTQEGGRDNLATASEIVASPPIMRI